MDRVRARVRREIDRRVERGEPKIGGEVRAAMRQSVTTRLMYEDDPERILRMWADVCWTEVKGKDRLGGFSVDQMQKLLYALAWCEAWGKRIDDYFEAFGIEGVQEVML